LRTLAFSETNETVYGSLVFFGNSLEEKDYTSFALALNQRTKMETALKSAISPHPIQKMGDPCVAPSQ
jgi:hypothetical protein